MNRFLVGLVILYEALGLSWWDLKLGYHQVVLVVWPGFQVHLVVFFCLLVVKLVKFCHRVPFI